MLLGHNVINFSKPLILQYVHVTCVIYIYIYILDSANFMYFVVVLKWIIITDFQIL